MKEHTSIQATELFCIYTHDGYGIGTISQTLYTSEEEAKKHVSADSEISCVMQLSEALYVINDGYWAKQHEGSCLPLGFFKSKLYQQLHQSGALNIGYTV